MGTFPGEKSRNQKQYYADSRNQFWNLMSYVLGIDLKEMEYEDRINILKKHKIGLWDTIESCEIVGSLDKNICNPHYNDFSHLSQIKKIVCNGGKVEEICKEHCTVPDGVQVVRVLSSSSANNGVVGRSEDWKEAIKVLL
ncbi:DNA-deoxyinosine glycosylase [Methanococcoides sp. FTZ1]|uniref:DNA-deoxyinosine glycosylase n=1 Tax=Methanococcoides sp. FTZ1 TaxID=3439061 RepID=UPI003F856EF1